jgi:hypothetical protein
MKSAVLLIDAGEGKPKQAAWELAAEYTVHEFRLPEDDPRYRVLVKFAQPYSADDLWLALRQFEPSTKREVRKVQLLPGNPVGFVKLCQSSFRGMIGTSDDTDIEAQRLYLQSNPKLAIKFAQDCAGGIELVSTGPDALPDNSDEQLELLPLAIVSTASKIETRQTLWSEEQNKPVSIRMTHWLGQESEKDWREWQRTSADTINRKSQVWKAEVDHQARVNLYDRFIQSIDGMRIDGASCTAENRSNWLARVPAWHKLHVITAFFNTVKLKNG